MTVDITLDPRHHYHFEVSFKIQGWRPFRQRTKLGAFLRQPPRSRDRLKLSEEQRNLLMLSSLMPR